MDILYLLIPLSAVLVLVILGVFAWALHKGQFDDLERHGEEMLARDPHERAGPDGGQTLDNTASSSSDPPRADRG